MMNKIIMWAITYNCNKKCQHCYLKSTHKLLKDLSEKQRYHILTKIIDSSDWVPDAVWLTGGEPTINKDLPILIHQLEINNIKTGITSNGYFSYEVAKIITKARPRRINISLDSQFINNKQVIDTLKSIAHLKDDYTTLGASVIITKENLCELIEMSKKLKEIGVEYLSLNPLYTPGETKNDVTINKKYCHIIEELKELDVMSLPSDEYLDMLYSYYRGERKRRISCPASDNYFFISPWGQLFPCSNELWQSHNVSQKVFISGDSSLFYDIKDLQNSINNKRYSTHAFCFSLRCMGCWKLFYDEKLK